MKVLKPFNSANRRFRVGDPIQDAEDVAPHSIEGLKARGFIGDETSVERPSRKPKSKNA